jgi:hypothetical protein
VEADLLVVTLVVMMVLLMMVDLMMVVMMEVLPHAQIPMMVLQMPMVMAVPDIHHTQVGVVDMMMMILYQQICAVLVVVEILVEGVIVLVE